MCVYWLGVLGIDGQQIILELLLHSGREYVERIEVAQEEVWHCKFSVLTVIFPRFVNNSIYIIN
jgi:hypothetical protein